VDDDAVFVESVEDQWRTPGAVYFRVRGDDGKTYLLAYNEGQDEWTVAFRR
jgi:hypothetical protein